MKNLPKLIVMLTHDDFTVPNAAEIFEQCRNSQADFWGFKEHPLPKKNMEELYARMKECGKTTFLEVVAYTEAEGLEGAKMAADCGCDILMGTIFYDSINEFCQQHQLKYMPFVGVVEGRPSVLSGDISDIVAEAQKSSLMLTESWRKDTIFTKRRTENTIASPKFTESVFLRLPAKL
ncbi:MAG: hypothetical protein IJZ92_07870 [Bacteroidaceae bacterium]|nr:hypothetical protein [Bacteroidaceae bacterium]